MREYLEQIEAYSKQFYQKYKRKDSRQEELPGKTYFLNDGSILCLPREDGDNRFPYGENGFNFWTYASGYMHANEGLFSPFLRANEGQEPKIAFFAGWKGKEEYQVLSLLAVPKLDQTCFGEVIRYTVFTKTCTYYITEVKEMRFAIRVFVDEKNHMYFSVLAQNNGNYAQELYVSAYLNPFLCNSIYENSENRWFRKSEFMEDESSGIGQFLFSMNEDLSRTVSVTNYGVINQSLTLGVGSRFLKQEATTSRYQYVGGSYSSLHTPEALKQGSFRDRKHVTAFNDVAVAGEILYLNIAAGKSVRLDMELSYQVHSGQAESYQKLIRKLEPVFIDNLVYARIMSSELESRTLQGSFGKAFVKGYDGDTLTFFFDYLKKQVEFCSLIRGYVQLSEGSLIGIRDVFQAMEGMLFYKPDQAKMKMIEALGFIAPNGRCPRQYSLPVNDMALPAMDLRQFIDQGVWVINTIITYLKFTGDFDLLKQTCGYYEIVDDKKKLVKKSDLTDTVLSHMLRIMDFLIRNQDPATGCIRALYGDWNDALDGLGVSWDGSEEFGSGVSVMVTLQVYQNLQDMVELLQILQGHEDTITKYQKVSAELEQGLAKYAILQNEEGESRIVHGWGDCQSYYVGSFHDPDGASRQGLTSNAFWVISDILKHDKLVRKTILQAFEYLDSKYGFKTFEPYFRPNTPGVGRIYKLPPGTAENGAAYIHATTFGIMALFMMGEPKKAWEQLMKIFPFTHSHISCSPYVMPNSYGYNQALNIDGESMQDWQTGSSNVVFKIILRFVFGFQPEYNGFFLQPATWFPFESYRLDLAYQDSMLHISYCNQGTGKRSFLINGKECPAIRDEDLKVDKLWMNQRELDKIVDISIQD